jgi:hypothetical protein
MGTIAEIAAAEKINESFVGRVPPRSVILTIIIFVS